MLGQEPWEEFGVRVGLWWGAVVIDAGIFCVAHRRPSDPQGRDQPAGLLHRHPLVGVAVEDPERHLPDSGGKDHEGIRAAVNGFVRRSIAISSGVYGART